MEQTTAIGGKDKMLSSGKDADKGFAFLRTMQPYTKNAGRKKLVSKIYCGAIVTILLTATGLAGCAASKTASASAQTTASANNSNDDPPDVHHCALVTISSPVLYACDGKIYTEHELSQRRLAMEKKQGSHTTSKVD